jgi:hypothetical protein
MLVLVLGAMIVVELSIELIRVEFFPTPVDIAREIDMGLAEGPDGTPATRVRWGDEDGYEALKKGKGNAPGGGVGAEGKGFPSAAPGTVSVISPISGAHAAGAGGGTGLAPPTSTAGGRVPASSPGNASSAGLLSPSGAYVGAQGMIVLPAQAVLGNMGEGEKARMGVVDAAPRSSYDFSGVARDGKSGVKPARPA